jgi:hypothetical protein
MNVRPETAYELLRLFAHLEHELKRVPRFIQGDVGRTAQVEWGQVGLALGQLSPKEFLDRVPPHVSHRLLSERDRPMKELVRLDHSGAKVVEFERVALPPSDAAALLEASKRVRNNLFHGGKVVPQPGLPPDDDEIWGSVAIEIVTILLQLVREGTLR